MFQAQTALHELQEGICCWCWLTVKGVIKGKQFCPIRNIIRLSALAVTHLMVGVQITIDQRDVDDLPVQGSCLFPARVEFIGSEQAVFLTLVACDL